MDELRKLKKSANNNLMHKLSWWQDLPIQDIKLVRLKLASR